MASDVKLSNGGGDRRKVQQPPCTMTFGPTGYKRDGVSLPVLDERSTTGPGERRAEGSYRAWLQACYDLSEDKIQCPRVILALRRPSPVGDLISREQAIAALDSVGDDEIETYREGSVDENAAVQACIQALRSLPADAVEAAPAPQPWTEGELAKAMHAERLEREGCRSNYADERWDESKADRERWYASARVAMRVMRGER